MGVLGVCQGFVYIMIDRCSRAHRNQNPFPKLSKTFEPFFCDARHGVGGAVVLQKPAHKEAFKEV